MQTRLKIALGAVGFALAAIPVFAVEMPTDGSKNFSPPADAPSYFTNETVPESARVDRAASFDNEEAGIGATTPDVEPAVSVGTDTKQYDRHASTHRSARRKAIDSGEQSVTGMAKLLNVHRVTLHKALKKDTAKRGTAA